jgi:hydroxyacylglutathione hydrolase
MLTVKAFSFNPVEENTYVLYNEKKQCCIIDPGCYFPEEKEQLRHFVEDNQLNPRLLLNTHCHLDHVFGNKFVSDTWRLPLHLHALEKSLLDFAPESGAMWNLPFDNYTGELIYLEPGSSIALGDDSLAIQFIPGHSPGHLGFYGKKEAFVIGGDVLFRGSVGRTDLPGGDFETLLRSIRQVLYSLPDETVVYPGHGDPTTIGIEKQTNPFTG